MECCVDQLSPPSLADILRCGSHVRFTPNQRKFFTRHSGRAKAAYLSGLSVVPSFLSVRSR